MLLIWVSASFLAKFSFSVFKKLTCLEFEASKNNLFMKISDSELSILSQNYEVGSLSFFQGDNEP